MSMVKALYREVHGGGRGRGSNERVASLECRVRREAWCHGEVKLLFGLCIIWRCGNGYLSDFDVLRRDIVAVDLHGNRATVQIRGVIAAGNVALLARQ